MNELQQVLLIFAVVVIAGLYFLSRSRQAESRKSQEENQNSATENQPYIAHQKASEALNELGEPHIPVSQVTEDRVTKHDATEPKAEQGDELSVQDVQHSNQNETENQSDDLKAHPDQGMLSFGEEFDLPKSNQPDSGTEVESHQTADEREIESPLATVIDETAAVSEDEAKTENNQPMHHVLVVDDPGMTGEVGEDYFPKDHIKPSFGIPEDQYVQTKERVSSTNKKPEVFAILVMSAGHEFEMTAVNQALQGVGLTLSEQGIFVKNDNMGQTIIKVANMLEPGTFPVENLEDYKTPGVAMILELPSTVKAPKAMDELIMMARKIHQRLSGRLYNMHRQLLTESEIQSMRDDALDYESEPLT